LSFFVIMLLFKHRYILEVDVFIIVYCADELFVN
jgi:hypothetical protein